jgi:hypothetical protein
MEPIGSSMTTNLSLVSGIDATVRLTCPVAGDRFASGTLTPGRPN